MSLLSALFVCSMNGGCKNALLNAAQNDPEALFLYRIWDEIPDQKNFSKTYISILTNKNVNIEVKNLYDTYLLAVFFQNNGLKEDASREYLKICKEGDGLFGAECCFRAYKLGRKEAKGILKTRYKNRYYLYFFE